MNKARQASTSTTATTGHPRSAMRPRAGSAELTASQAERSRGLEQQLVQLRREHERLTDALAAAARVQRILCSPRELRVGRYEIASEIFPLHHLSGDFFHVMRRGARLGLALGDIAGKGLVAGLWLTHLVGLIRLQADSLPHPAAATAAINRQLCNLGAEPPMAGLFLASLDTGSGEFVYCNAGLPAALLLRAGGAVEELQEGGPMPGAMPAAEFRSGQAKLRPGDAVLAFSDGLVECRNSSNKEFGVERLLNAARAAAGNSAGNLLFSILAALQDFSNGTPRCDDLAVSVIRRRA